MVYSLYLEELKFRFYYLSITSIWSFILLFNYKEHLLFSILENIRGVHFESMQFLNLMEVFFSELKLIVILFLIMIISLFLMNLYLFLLGCLYEYENKIFLEKLIKFILYLLILYYVMFNKCLKAVITYFLENIGNLLIEVNFEPRVEDFLYFYLYFCLVYFLFLILPIVLNKFLDYFGVERGRVILCLINIIIAVLFLPSDLWIHIGYYIVILVGIEVCIYIKKWSAWWNR